MNSNPFQANEITPGELPLSSLRRHLGLPAEADWDENTKSLANAARDWFQANGTPWVRSVELPITAIDENSVHLGDDKRLTSARLALGLQKAQADRIVVVAVSAGFEIEDESHRLWKCERPDEAMFLNAVAIGATEHFRSWCGEQLRKRYEADGQVVLPHYSPGYEGWDLAEQQVLYRLLSDRIEGPAVSPEDFGDDARLEVLASGSLSPKSSTLAVFGIGRDESGSVTANYWDRLPAASAGTANDRTYSFPEKALRKWARERLKLEADSTQGLRAHFRFDGTTCSLMGRPLAFDYHVELEKEQHAEDYRIVDCSCRQAEDDFGLESMCGYQSDPDEFLQSLSDDQRFWSGKTLDHAFDSSAELSRTACLCTRSDRDHKWRIVLQTLYWALENGPEKGRESSE